MKCEHPDHEDDVSCEDRAVACHKDCACCLPPCQHTHVIKLSGGGSEPEWIAVCNDCGVPLGQNEQGYYALPERAM